MKTFLTHLQESGLNPQFNYGGSSTGQGLDQYDPAADLNAQSEREIKKSCKIIIKSINDCLQSLS